MIPDLPNIKIWEAARATSAAPFYFKPATVDGVSLLDGGLQANNPLGWLWNEVLNVFGAARDTSCFLSIGTGTPVAKPLAMPPGFSLWKPIVSGQKWVDYALNFSGVPTNTEITNLLFRSLINAFAPKSMAKKYWRINFGGSLPDWVPDPSTGEYKWVFLFEAKKTDKPEELGDLDDITVLDKTPSKTTAFLKRPETQKMIADCAAALKPGGGGNNTSK